MAIPDYQSVFLPLLKLTSDGKEHRFSEIIDQLANEFNLTEDEKNELLPSGQPKIYNRVQWAKTYLVQAGLLQATRRSHVRITERGQEVIGRNPEKINVQYLTQFAEFNEFRARRSNNSEGVTASDEAVLSSSETPDELLRSTHKNLEARLSGELLQRVLSAPPAFFESTIVALLLSMGYGGSREDAGRAIGKSGDGGLDGVIDQDPLGLDRVYLQAKRYRPDMPVSEPEIRGFSGSLGAAKANKGVFVTTSFFTRPAIEFAERHPFKIVLIDGDELTKLMMRHNIGVRIIETLHLKKIDEDYFSEE